ncbi:MAG: peptidylprolyl isomerase, partial [Pseudomonadota bacterium]
PFGGLAVDRMGIAALDLEAGDHAMELRAVVLATARLGEEVLRVVRGFMIQGGDPLSVDGEPSEWGTGGGDVTQPQEFSELAHFRGYLASAKRGGQTESSTYQFYITVGEPHHLNNQHTVFGEVLEGMAVADQIVGGEIEEGTADRPANPVVIESAVVTTD